MFSIEPEYAKAKKVVVRVIITDQCNQSRLDKIQVTFINSSTIPVAVMSECSV